MSTQKWIMVVAVLLAGLTLNSCANPNPQPAGLTPIPTLAPGPTVTLVSEVQPAGQTGSAGGGKAVAAEGTPVYYLNCTLCHGVEAEGVTAPALRVNQFIQNGTDQDVFLIIAQGRSGTAMPAWSQANGGPLLDTQIRNVVAFLRTLQGVAALPSATPPPPAPTEAPLPPNSPTEPPAQPSNPGEAGPAAALVGDIARGEPIFGQVCALCHGPEGAQGVPNPGSEDGSVPPLNPIDPTLVNPDPKLFAANLDLFLEHGSVPAGDAPMILMPPFGDSKMFTDQEMADVIAYMMALSGVTWAK